MEYRRYNPFNNCNPNSDTFYTVTVTDAIGCSATASTTVTILPRPLITVSATPTSVCKSGTSNLLATISNPVYAVSSNLIDCCSAGFGSNLFGNEWG
ncbi:MAG: hypothetical protein IPL25_06560 [Saprospiraceae bacterium]|nr:hypothetical protein [Candidatus Vicinibacter affinis]